MNLTVTTTVSGSVELQSGIVLFLDFSLPKQEEQVRVNFSFIHEEVSISGNLLGDKLTHYNVHDGIITDEVMQEVEDKIKEVLDIYIEKK